MSLTLTPCVQVSDKIYCCRSGSAADTQAIADYVKLYLDLHENENDEDPTVEVSHIRSQGESQMQSYFSSHMYKYSYLNIKR